MTLGRKGELADGVDIEVTHMRTCSSFLKAAQGGQRAHLSRGAEERGTLRLGEGQVAITG